MSHVSKLKKVILGTGIFGGALLYYYLQPKKAYASWTTNYTPNPHLKWDENWDHRCPKSIVKRSKNNNNIQNDNFINEEIEKNKPMSTRHLILIRHGQYNTSGRSDDERCLTELGRKQAEWTGQRLKDLKIPYTELVKSTMKRAQETGLIIQKSLPSIPVENCSLLEEGAPVPPDPAVGHWKPEYYFYQDGARIEAAFRRYFYRADNSQEKDSYTILVCHANVIRYFVCRALQFPAEAWLRLSLNHASITWISITPNGRVILRTLGDSGHMPVDGISYR